MATRARRTTAARRPRGFAPGRAAVRPSMLDRYLPHFDARLRHRATVPLKPRDTWALLERLDFAQICQSAGRAIEDMRDVPDDLLRVARRARRILPDVRFIMRDAVRHGFVELERKPDRHILLGAVGKLWKPRIELLPLDGSDFGGFDQPKYVKLISGFLALPLGTGQTDLKHETRFLATDDSARAHFLRRWDSIEPYVTFFLRQVMKSVVAVAKEHRATPIPPWRQPRP